MSGTHKASLSDKEFDDTLTDIGNVMNDELLTLVFDVLECNHTLVEHIVNSRKSEGRDIPQKLAILFRMNERIINSVKPVVEEIKMRKAARND